MYSKIQKLLQARSDMLCKGQFEELAMLYHVPFIAYHDGVPTVVGSHSQAVGSLRKVAALMASRGVVGLDVEVTSVELPKNGRYRVWSRYSEIDRSGNVISRSDVVQYLVESPRGALVEMIESFKCPLAEIWEHGEPASA